MASSQLVLLIVTISIGQLIMTPSLGAEEDPECRQRPKSGPQKNHEVCCELPIMQNDVRDTKEAFKSCREELKEKQARSVPPPPSTEATLQTNPPSTTETANDRSKLGRNIVFPRSDCMEQCVFNKSGLLTQDSKLNLTAISNKINNLLLKDEKWKDTVISTAKKCIEKAPENVRESSVCKSGARQFTKCIMRETFLNCPQDKWKSSENCNKEKARLEKCPKQLPLPHFLPQHRRPKN